MVNFQKYMKKQEYRHGPTVKTTSKITKSHGYGSKLESKAVSSVSKTFDISLMGASSKSCEYVLDTLMQVFEDKWFAHAVKERTLDNLITEILIWLPDERVPRMHDGSQLLKVLNVLMLKILDNAKRTLLILLVIISLLDPIHPSRCLLDEVNLDHILQIIHVYLQELWIDEKQEEVILSTEFNLIWNPQPIILAYIDVNLQRELAPINNNNIPNSAEARLTYLLYYKTQAVSSVYVSIQKKRLAGFKTNDLR
ncbi:hypothetical protein Tco_1458745 [Tanacetum coccineum]